MILKNRVALYGIVHDKVLTYKEVIDKMNWNHWLFLKVLNASEDGALFIRVPDDSTLRDIEMFAKGIQSAKPKWIIERTNYVN